ncbi:MAG: C10 family peptidase [Bacteroidales bacterium]|nr:C10 family peptidase [Bacteroidales bacterium]
MNKIHLSAILMALTFLIVSCVETNDQLTTKSQSYLEHRTLLTKAAIDALSAGVTAEDVESYLNCRMNVQTSNIQDISRYNIDEDAAIFIVNLKEGGWFLCSGDYSSIPVIAYSETGSFSLAGKLSPTTQGWLQTIREQIVNNRNSNSETVQANRNDWVLVKRVALTRSEDPDTMEVDIVVDSEILRDDYYPALIETSWNPVVFNDALPKMSSTARCYASTADVNIAQLVYYTHFAFGYPNDTFASASCDDNYTQGPPYSFVFSNPSTATWNYMPAYYAYGQTGNSYVAALIALVSSRCGTQYNPYGGQTSRTSIPGAMSDFLLTGVTNQSFNKYDAIDEIEDDRPVLCTGAYSSSGQYDATYLIDGYEWQIIRETEYVYDMQGHLLEQNVNTLNYFRWHYNTGDVPNTCFWGAENCYYPYNQIMHIGW